MPAAINRLGLASTAPITAVSLGRDGRVCFAIAHNGPGPGVSYGQGIGDLGVDAYRGVWVTMPCTAFGSRCGAGYARFGGDYGPLHKIHPLGKADGVPLGIAMMANGGVWIAEQNTNAVVSVTPGDKATVVTAPRPGVQTGWSGSRRPRRCLTRRRGTRQDPRRR
ncbi:MAG TPA: hypothetical protein VII69_00935 [Candidatus Eremiobacteraceae bacterium]